MKVLSWNYKGLGIKAKEEAMKKLIRLAQLDTLLIQETKMEKDMFLQVSANFWKKGGRSAVSSSGASRGIGTLWDDQKFELIESKHCLRCILTKLLHKDSNIQVSLFNIYVPAMYAEKKIVGTS